MGDPARTAREVVELYNLSVWNERNFDMADELVADTMIRHDVGSGHAVTRQQVRKGIEDLLAMFDKLHWDPHLVIAGDDGQHVAVVYNGTMTKGGDEAEVAGMEVYRVVDGEITEMWNGGDKQGLWL
jgi:predicted SnoaL-like aldol condensation-catalyzing enzyme